MWNVSLYFLSSGIRQVAYPYARIGKSKSTNNRIWFLIKFIAIRLTQQLFCVGKTVMGKEIVKVFVTAGKTGYIVRLIQPM